MPGDDTSEASTQTFDRDGPWFTRIREECHAVRDAAGILDLPGFSRFRLQGDGARAWLSSLITGSVPKPGRIGLAYFPDERRRIVTEMSVTAVGEESFFLITAAAAESHDFEWLRNHQLQTTPRALATVTEGLSCQILSGPGSRDTPAAISAADVTSPWRTPQSAQTGDHWSQLVRASLAGEPGWEIHSKVADTAAIFDRVWA